MGMHQQHTARMRIPCALDLGDVNCELSMIDAAKLGRSTHGILVFLAPGHSMGQWGEQRAPWAAGLWPALRAVGVSSLPQQRVGS